MSNILGIAYGEMKKGPVEPIERDVEIINSLLNPPPVPVIKDDIYVRRCRLASDAIDCGYGRFRTELLSRLLDLAQGVPMLIGHKKDGVGIARFFGGSIERLEGVYNPFTQKMEGITYIVPKFYWMRNHSQAEDLRINIDGGIYNQVSLSWWYKKATCGICGEDMRKCAHVPGRVHDGELAFYYYDDVIEVLEGSIVYAGGQPNTGFYLNEEKTRGLHEGKKIYYSSSSMNGAPGICRSDVERYIQRLSGDVSLRGILRDGTCFDGIIEIACDPVLRDRVARYLPPALRDQFTFAAAKDRCNVRMEKNTARHTASKNLLTADLFPGHGNDVRISYSCQQLSDLSMPVYVEPLYDGIPVTVQREGSDIVIIDSNDHDISGKTTAIAHSLLEFPSRQFTAQGVLTAYRGRTRLDYAATYHVLHQGEKQNELQTKLKIHDLCALNGSVLAGLSFHERRSLLDSFFQDAWDVQLVKGELAWSSIVLHSIIDRISSRDGAVVRYWEEKKANAPDFFIIRKRQLLNAKVINRALDMDGYRYECAVTREGQEYCIGWTGLSPLVAEEGEIIRIEINRINSIDNLYFLDDARVISRLPGRSAPDTFSTYAALSEYLTVRNPAHNELYELLEEKNDAGTFVNVRFFASAMSGVIRMEENNGFTNVNSNFSLMSNAMQRFASAKTIGRGAIISLYRSGGNASFLLHPEGNGIPMILQLKKSIMHGAERWLGKVQCVG